MTAKYVSEQPQGYDNHIRKIAMVGAGGQCGKYITKALLETQRFEITAVTRSDSTSNLPEHPKLTVSKVSYDDLPALTSVLNGHDALIITMASRAPRSVSQMLIRAAAEAKVPWVLPNEWGIDLNDEGLVRDIGFDTYIENRRLIQDSGISSYIAFVNGFWYEYSLSFLKECYGFDLNNKKVVLYDDGKTAINTSCFPQVGEGVVALLSLPVLPQDEDDKSVTLSDWRNKTCYIASFTMSQEDMLASVLRVTGDQREDWTIEYEDSQKRYQRGVEAFDGGKGPGGAPAFAMFLYARNFFQDGCGNFGEKHGLSNEKLGLKKEDPDGYTRIAIQWAKEKAA